MTAAVLDADRAAVATLLRVTEPGVAGLVRHVRDRGVHQTLADIRAGATIADIDVAALQHRLRTASGEADLEAAAAVGARLVCRGDDEWPPLLEHLRWVDRDCLGLWVRGDRSLAEATERSISVVGTRAATDYGVHVAGQLSCDLAEMGWTIVSGLAYGIDATAHRGALAAGGLTVAVLACGVDVPYPRGHRSLYERIAAEGLVVSEHPPGAAPQRPRFLVRNRIIAAL
jgi:DNA processing protein